jgi:hypothetical protein
MTNEIENPLKRPTSDTGFASDSSLDPRVLLARVESQDYRVFDGLRLPEFAPAFVPIHPWRACSVPGAGHARRCLTV